MVMNRHESPKVNDLTMMLIKSSMFLSLPCWYFAALSPLLLLAAPVITVESPLSYLIPRLLCSYTSLAFLLSAPVTPSLGWWITSPTLCLMKSLFMLCLVIQ